ncbi:MAG TPA: hypothetical protein VF916_04425, partial [Ktedonobacterales bacterium]
SVAYIDLKTGALHVVRSDDQRDHVVVKRLVAQPGAVTWAGAAGQAILAGLAWSPDGTQLAYLSDPTATGQATLGVVRADGGSPAVTLSVAGATASLAVWSPDGQRLAFVQTDAAGQRSVWDANVSAQQLLRLGAAGRDASATVRSLAWLPATSGPTVTWASVDPASGSVTGLFVDQILQDSEARPVTASGLVFSAAAFSPARLGGTWLLVDGTSVYEVSPTAPSLAQLFSVSSGVSSITWSSDGSMAAILSTNGDLRIWTQATHAPLVANGVSQQVAVAWAPDGSALAFVAGGQISITRIQGGEAGSVTTVAGLVNVTAVAWAPDSQRLAVATVGGVASVTADGASAQVDGHSATGALIWSVAR